MAECMYLPQNSVCHQPRRSAFSRNGAVMYSVSVATTWFWIIFSSLSPIGPLRRTSPYSARATGDAETASAATPKAAHERIIIVFFML